MHTLKPRDASARYITWDPHQCQSTLYSPGCLPMVSENFLQGFHIEQIRFVVSLLKLPGACGTTIKVLKFSMQRWSTLQTLLCTIKPPNFF